MLISSAMWAKVLKHDNIIKCLKKVPGFEEVNLQMDVPPLVKKFVLFGGPQKEL